MSFVSTLIVVLAALQLRFFAFNIFCSHSNKHAVDTRINQTLFFYFCDIKYSRSHQQN